MIALRHIASGVVHNATSAEGYDLAEWEEIAPVGAEPDAFRNSLRPHRDACLAASDWTQLSDSPLSEAKRGEWAVYRQALRDLPETADPADFEWPEPPTA